MISLFTTWKVRLKVVYYVSLQRREGRTHSHRLQVTGLLHAYREPLYCSILSRYLCELSDSPSIVIHVCIPQVILVLQFRTRWCYLLWLSDCPIVPYVQQLVLISHVHHKYKPYVGRSYMSLGSQNLKWAGSNCRNGRGEGILSVI
jgi:hypothetical protein